jgi:hypothetical protein
VTRVRRLSSNSNVWLTLASNTSLQFKSFQLLLAMTWTSADVVVKHRDPRDDEYTQCSVYEGKTDERLKRPILVSDLKMR